MNRTLSTLIAIAAAVSLSGQALAQRHDEKPHGYDAKVAAAQAQTTADATRYVALPMGPRAQGTPTKVKVAVPSTMSATAPQAGMKAN